MSARQVRPGVWSAGGLDALDAIVERLGTMRVTAGIQAQEGAIVEEGTTLLTIAEANEFGVRDDEGNVRVPERSFLRAALDRRKGEWAAFARVNAKAALVHRQSLEVAANRIGNVMRGDVQQQITDSVPPAVQKNAESTIARKGSSHPLIDTGTMRQSIRYAAELDGHDVGVG